jgi:hypothetical protein
MKIIFRLIYGAKATLLHRVDSILHYPTSYYSGEEQIWQASQNKVLRDTSGPKKDEADLIELCTSSIGLLYAKWGISWFSYTGNLELLTNQLTTESVSVGFVVDKVALGPVFL